MFGYLRNGNGEIEKILNGTLSRVQVSISFATIDGGYATAYVLNKTHTAQDSVDPTWQCYIRFLRPKSDTFTKPVLIYQTNSQLRNMGFSTCYVSLDR